MTPEEYKEAVRLAKRYLRWQNDPETAPDDETALVANALLHARAMALKEAALKVRHDCTMCEGSGHASPDIGEDGEDHECEYCGRPMAAIRALASTEGE